MKQIFMFAINTIYSIEQALDFVIAKVEVDDTYYQIYIKNNDLPSKDMLVKVNRHIEFMTIYIQANGWREAVNVQLESVLKEIQTNELLNQKIRMLEM
jgi:hypothetical protein